LPRWEKELRQEKIESRKIDNNLIFI